MSDYPANYPPVGETWVFDIGPALIAHRYDPGQIMHFHNLTGEFAGEEGDVSIFVQQVAPGQFLASWQEANNITVVHWEDFNTGRFEAFATMPDLSFHRFSGKMWRRD